MSYQRRCGVCNCLEGENHAAYCTVGDFQEQCSRERLAAKTPPTPECADLAMMVRRLAHALKAVDPHNNAARALADKGLDLLERKGLSRI